MGTVKIDELIEVCYAIDRKIELNRRHKMEIERKGQLIVSKLINTENPTFIKVLEKEQEKLDAEDIKNQPND